MADTGLFGGNTGLAILAGIAVAKRAGADDDSALRLGVLTAAMGAKPVSLVAVDAIARREVERRRGNGTRAGGDAQGGSDLGGSGGSTSLKRIDPPPPPPAKASK